MGDLNYRIEMEDDILRAWVEEKRYKNVLEKDQVCNGYNSSWSYMRTCSFVVTLLRANRLPISLKVSSTSLRKS